MYTPQVEGEERFMLMGPPAFPRYIFIESDRIDACMDYALRNHGGRIAITALGGFKLPDLSFLSRFPWVEELNIQHADMIDISGVSALARLRSLLISGKAKQPLDLANFPHLRELRIQWWPKLRLGDALTSLRALTLSHYSPASNDLSGLPEMPHLEELDLVQSQNPTLSGIDRYRSLKKVEVAYFPRLVDLSALSAFTNGVLGTLEFQRCPKLANHDHVKVIRALKRLAFNSCGEISSLKFLDDLEALESFSFVHTNIVDGDLTPCLRLQFAGFFNKRHYSHRSSDFPEAGTSTNFNA
jgi:hypothetical protein